MAADTGRFPTNLATANAPGAMSAAQNNQLATLVSTSPIVTRYAPAGANTSFVLSGLAASSAWKIEMVLPAVGGHTNIKLQPNGSDSGCESDAASLGGSGGFTSSYGYLMGGGIGVAGTLTMWLGARLGGYSAFRAEVGRGTGGGYVGQSVVSVGSTSTNFTSLTIDYGGASLTGVVIRVTETPGIGDLT